MLLGKLYTACGQVPGYRGLEPRVRERPNDAVRALRLEWLCRLPHPPLPGQEFYEPGISCRSLSAWEAGSCHVQVSRLHPSVLRLFQDSPGCCLNVIASGKRPKSYRTMVERVVTHWRYICACVLFVALGRSSLKRTL